MSCSTHREIPWLWNLVLLAGWTGAGACGNGSGPEVRDSATVTDGARADSGAESVGSGGADVMAVVDIAVARTTTDSRFVGGADGRWEGGASGNVGPDGAIADARSDGGAKPEVSAQVDAPGMLDATTEARDAATREGGPVVDTGPSCPVVTAGPFEPRSARSGGFPGGDVESVAIQQKACSAASECTSLCLSAGGSEDFCTAGMECQGGCDLPPFWSQYASVVLPVNILQNPGSYHDPLILSDFGVQVPADATITGIQFELTRYHKAAGEPGISDHSVRVLQDGRGAGVDHKNAADWPTGRPILATYGGARDLWGVSWTSAAVMSSAFGLSISASCSPMLGFGWIYVDQARVSVTYVPAHCDQEAGDSEKG